MVARCCPRPVSQRLHRSSPLCNVVSGIFRDWARQRPCQVESLSDSRAAQGHYYIAASCTDAAAQTAVRRHDVAVPLMPAAPTSGTQPASVEDVSNSRNAAVFQQSDGERDAVRVCLRPTGVAGTADHGRGLGRRGGRGLSFASLRSLQRHASLTNAFS